MRVALFTPPHPNPPPQGEGREGVKQKKHGSADVLKAHNNQTEYRQLTTIKAMPKGIYTLLIRLDKPRTITIGKRGRVFFPAGYYVYVGSALNGIESRIARHLKKKKALHWHIDYFLQKARVEEIIYSLTEKNKECALAFQLSQKLPSIPHFGCSDCRCISHLYFCEERVSLKKIIRNSFKKVDLIPYICAAPRIP